MKLLLLISSLFISTFTIGQELPVPEGLNASLVKSESNQYIQLKWEPVEVDSLNIAYNIFKNFPPDSILYLYGKAGMVWDTVYNIPLNSNYADSYKLSICSVVNFPQIKRSKQSKSVEVIVPTKKLPLFQLSAFSHNGNKANLKWDYPEIKDLEAFVFYINDKIVKTLNPGIRSFSYQFDKSGTFALQVQAVTTSGISSNKSQKRVVKITPMN